MEYGRTQIRCQALAGALLVVLAVPGVAAARARPDLRVSAITRGPRSVHPGGRFTVRDTVVNAGGGRAGPSTTTFALSRDARAGHDIALKGRGRVKRLAARGRAIGKARVTVPARVAPGSYRLLACADGRRQVRERSERDNWRAARGHGRVTAVPHIPAPSPSPTPHHTSTPTPTPTPTPAPAGDPAPDYHPPSAPAAAPEEAVAVTTTDPQHLVRFAVDAPGTLLSDVPIALNAGEHVTGLDQDPATGRLIAHTDEGRVLAIDPATGNATAVTTADLGPGPLGEDIDPVAGGLDATDASGHHEVVDLASGTIDDHTSLTYAPGDPGASATPQLDALGFTDSVPGAFSTELYGIDASGATAKLVEVTDDALGLVRTVGDTAVATTGDAGFDIDGTTGSAYAVLTPAAGARSGVYRVDLGTGHATAVGAIGAAGTYGSLALLPTPAGTPPPAPVQALSDGWTPISDPSDFQWEFDPSTCAVDEPYHAMNAAAAVSSLQAFLRAEAGQGALDAVAAAPQDATALGAVQAAAGAITDDSPGAALATLLRAHQLAPDDPSVMLDIASLATAVGKSSEALALIAAAESMTPPDHGPMGLSWTGRLQLARAHAFASLAQWTNAERSADAAQSFEPALTQEAAGILAAVSYCRDGDRAAAAIHVARAAVRNDPQQPIDDSQGHVYPLRNLPFPALPVNAAADHGFWNGLQQEIGQEANAQAQVRNQLDPLVHRPQGEPATVRREIGLWSRAVQQQSGSPDVDALFDRFTTAVSDAEQVQAGFFSGPNAKIEQFLTAAQQACVGSSDTDTCLQQETYARCSGPLKAAHAEWLSDMGRADDAAGRRMILISRRMSAVAANVSDPDIAAYVANEIKVNETTAAGELVTQTDSWTGIVQAWSSYCVDPPVSPIATAPPAGGSATVNPCPDDLKRINVKSTFDLGQTEAGDKLGLSVTVNCSDITTEGSVGVLPFISAFASVTYAPKSGATTLVIGGKFKVGASGPLEGNFQSGLYLKLDAQGHFQDAGWRTGPGMRAGAQEVAYQATDTMDLSFVEGLRYAFLDSR